jgi:serine protease Do
MRRIIAYGPALVVLACTGVVLLSVPAAVRAILGAQARARVTLARQSLEEDDVLERLSAASRAVAEAVEPSVVHVDVGGRPEGRLSAGSGWVWDDLGHVVTNAHVVAGARDVTVQFRDGQTAAATIVGVDAPSDIAVLRVEPGDHLIPIRRATGQRVRKGDRVFAFGSPFGFKFSMSEGIVSGLGRSARTALGFAGYSNYIQTDAAVNPGNSGGPLVDVRGRLVGMNVAIATAQDSRGTTEGQSAGISFAIPLAMIESRVPQLIAGGPVLSGYLGITFRAEDPFDGTPLGGVRVTSVVPGGPADRAGLRVDDLIVRIDDQDITGAEVLRAVISASSPGQEVRLLVRRGREQVEITATLAEFPRAVRGEEFLIELAREFGLVLREVREGAVVWEVMEDSPAAHSGLARGMLLLSVDGITIRGAGEAATTLLSRGLLAGRAVPVRVRTADGVEAEIVLRTGPE